jgi:flavin reductase (DIM6/NTAB) family NADH-FMN oxidoreductase RutF
MLSIDMHSLTVMEKQQWLQHAIAPRPIALASTIDAAGNANLSPFSFFNMVSTQPPMVIFCPSRRVRDNTTKHTLQNVAAIPEVVINICDYDIVQQTSLSSCEFEQGTDEFIKAGFNKQKALHVQPPMVKEAKVKLECRVTEIKSLGNVGGAGQLVFAEVICMHIDDSVLNETRTMIDQTKLQHIARLGGDWYSVVNEQSLFKVPKPNTKVGIGVDGLPDNIRNSKVLTGNNLGMLANVTGIPDIDPNFEDDTLKHIVIYYSLNPEEMERELHIYAASLLDAGKIDDAWQVLLAMIY